MSVNDYHEQQPETELPMLAGIAAILRWFEELLNIVNGPLLLFGAGIALVDLLTDGALTVSIPLLLFGWAISQALGIDTQLLGCFARARIASGWHRFGWLALGIVLGYAAWQAGDVFAIQQAQHITEAQALAQLHMDPAIWLGWRAFLAVGLVALSGWTRYRAPAKVQVSLADEREQLERELTLEPLRLRLRAQQVGGIRALAQTALTGQQGTILTIENGAIASHTPVVITGSAHEQQPVEPYTAEHAMEAVKRDLQLTDYPPSSTGDKPLPPVLTDYPPSSTGDKPLPPVPPTDGGTPVLGSNLAREAVPTGPLPVNSVGNVTPIRRRGLGRRPKLDRKTASRANAKAGRRGSAEQRVRTVLGSNPGIEFDDLVKRAKVAPSTASKYLAVIEAERANHRVAR